MNGGIFHHEGDRHFFARWFGAAAAVLFLHAMGVWVVAQQRSETFVSDGAASAIMVDLTPFPATSANEAADMALAPDASEVQPDPVAEADDPASEDASLEELDIPLPPQAEVTLPVPPPLVKKLSPSKPQERKKPRTPAKEKRRSGQQDKAATASAGSQAASAPVFAASQGMGTGSSASPASWHSILLSRINRAKRYPREAQIRQEKGVTRVNFTIDRNGRVLNTRIVSSSGSSILDQEALATIQRVSPLPAPPPEVVGARITLAVPIRFR